MMKIRRIVKSDLPALKQVLNSIELFPAEMLEDMIADYFNNKETEDIWFTAIRDDIPVSIGYCAPEQLTNGTFNLYAIGVLNTLQGQGIGSRMMDYLEDLLRANGHRILIVETSGTADFERTRTFYLKKDYKLEATIRDFWMEGDDKVIFWKKLF